MGRAAMAKAWQLLQKASQGLVTAPCAVVDGGSGVPYPPLPIAPREGPRDVAVTIVKPSATLAVGIAGAIELP